MFVKLFLYKAELPAEKLHQFILHERLRSVGKLNVQALGSQLGSAPLQSRDSPQTSETWRS